MPTQKRRSTRPMATGHRACVVGLTLALFGSAQSGAAQVAASAWVVHEPARREFVVTVGPLVVPQAGDDHIHHTSSSFAVAIPVAGWMRAFEVALTDTRGDHLPQRMLHHLNVLVPGERELFSPIMRRIGAAGPETGRVAAPPGVGYPLRMGDTLLVTVMLHNPSDRPIEMAYAHVRIGYAPAGGGLPILGVYPFYMDVLMRPGARSYDLPPGRSEMSWEGRPAASGRILGVSGHLHRHAVMLRFEDLTVGRMIWEARPRVDAEGNVVAMPTARFLWRLGVPLRTDHTYRLTAIYDNPTGDTIRSGAMGALGGLWVPSGRATLPAADRSDPVYVLDRRITIESHHAPRHSGHAEHGEHSHHHAPSAGTRPAGNGGRSQPQAQPPR